MIMGSRHRAAAALAPVAGVTLAHEERPGLWRQIREDVACVKSRDPAARGTLEILLTYPGVHAVIWYRLAHRLWRANVKFPARFLSWLGRLVSNVDIHPGARIGRRFFIDHGACVVIGETAEVGDDVTLYHGVTLGGTSWTPGKRHPTLQDGVLVGAGAKILGPITVGAGARVGANSVVIEDVPPGMTVVGIPGRVVKPLADRRRLGDGRIDLEHHLMPDPVGEAVCSLLDRIEFLEARLAHHQEQGHPGADLGLPESAAGSRQDRLPKDHSSAA
ncbi:serine O-acetyltransferase [Azorhizobium caulinodans ORS 571]|uniref:Serine acetyltransferase n=1 Tax=Azorhizobium caulinodans (strain ATCC 43989 / DSM 5975 / JCM 20966 / LMG 6465 / NBRC 14845 / NCIMB 13405 / ORS 571) TaxID=438753 RepID=A8IIC3_AZOC5|nr:serine O-acetyltransferase [Azorhizobium caulinodans ORS 571]